MNGKWMINFVMLAVLFLLTSCAGNMPGTDEVENSPEAVGTESELAPAAPSETPAGETPDRSELRPVQTPPPGLEQVELTPTGPILGEVPAEIMEAIISDAIERSGADREDIQVARAEAVVWSDGALGCPQPGDFYIQVLIDGYWVVLQAEGIEYDYRVSDKGSFILCEGGQMPPISTSEPGGEVHNSLVDQAKEDLAKRLDVPVSEIEMIMIEEVTWRDGSLGCPQPGMLYTQVLVNGSLIQLRYGGTIYQYHSGRGGAPFLCEDPPKNLDEAIAPGEAPPLDLGDQ